MTPPIEVFYSYSHKDEAYREQLEAHLAILQRQGIIRGWHDRMIDAGDRWRDEIDAHLESAQLMLFMVSPDFLASDYCYDVEMKRALEREAEGTARVVPIILRDCLWQETPFSDLQALPTDGLPIARWEHRDEAFAEVARGIKSAALRLRESPVAGVVGPFLETGAMPDDSPFYIERDVDRFAAEHFGKPDKTLVIKGYRQSGKSSMLNRLHADDDDVVSGFLDFQALGGERFEDPSQLFRALAQMIADELEWDIAPKDIWRSDREPKQNLTLFVEELLKSRPEKGMRLIFDEADRAFPFAATREDLFSMIRAWHNRRSRPNRPAWKRLELIIAHSTEPALWIRDPNQSPFNVGIHIHLDDFTTEEIGELNRRYGGPLGSRAEIESLTKLVGGHPYLVRLALYTLSTRHLSLAELAEIGAKDGGPFAPHLNHLLRLLLEDADLKNSVREVLRRSALGDEMHFQSVWSAGLVRGDRRESVAMRCELYRTYLGDRL